MPAKTDHINDVSNMGSALKRKLDAAEFLEGSENAPKRNGSAIALEDRLLALSQRSVLKSMTLVNFMCHEHLKIEFTSPITFIVGQNGSGKSAILTALMVCLGSAATRTQRGHKVADLIKENASSATIIITLDNSDRTQYKHEEYGDIIIIERRISRDGSGYYKTKSHSGDVVSAKKSEITAICDHFRLLIDNPAAILTQDDAKKYLISSSPEDRYKLFMDGTCLQQLANDYKYIRQRISGMGVSLEALESSQSSLQSEILKLENQISIFRQLKVIQEKIQSLKDELVWAYPRQKSLECDHLKQMITQLEQKLAKCADRKQMLQSQIDQFTEQLSRSSESRSLSELETNYKQITSQIHMLDSMSHQMDTDKSRIQSSIDQIRSSLNELDDVLSSNMDESATLSQKQSIKQLEGQISEVEASVNSINDQISSVEHQKFRSEGELVNIQTKSRQLDQESSSVLSQISSLESSINGFRASISDRARIFGQNVPQVLDFIKNNGGCDCIGPIGMLVKLKDQVWSAAMEAIIGRYLGSFIVTSYKDRGKLRDILGKFQSNNQILLVSPDDTLNTSNDDGRYLTALQILDIKDALVAKTLCNLTGIDRILLCKTRTEAIPILKSTTFTTAFTVDAAKVTLSGGKQSFFSYNREHSKHFDDPKVQLDYTISRLESKKKEKALLEKQKKEASEQLGCIRNELDASTISLQDCLNEKKALAQRMIQLKRQLDSIMMLSTTANDHDHLEKEKQSYQRQLELLESQRATIVEKKKELEDKKRPSMLSQLSRLRSEIDSIKAELRLNEERTEQFLLKRQSLGRDLNSCALEEKSISDELAATNRAFGNLILEVKDLTEKAEQYAPGANFELRTIDEIERELRDSQIMIDQSRLPSMEQLDQIVSDINSKRRESKKLSIEVDNLRKISKKLEQCVLKREQLWIEYRKNITVRSMITFHYLLSTRGLQGRLSYSHQEAKLHIVVQKPDQKEKTSISNQSVKSLSGGEKSLSTTCFLLSLWESIETSLRCLDEFDVFMDGVNRQVVMDLIVNYARSSTSQYIFITPQALNRSDNVNVIRMEDPERIKTIS